MSSCSKLVTFSLMLLAPFVAFTQGQIIFDNRVSATVIAPVYDFDPAHPETAKQGNTAQGIPVGTQTYAGTPLAGSGYTAQLFAGPTNARPENLSPLQPAVAFRSGNAAGFVVPPTFAVTVDGVREGQKALVQLRVWNNGNGTVTDWNQVLGNSEIERGETVPFVSGPLGGIFTPPPNLIGLQSFNLSRPSDLPLTLSIRMSNGVPELSASGPPGRLCHIEYAPEVEHSGPWIELTDFVLPSSPYVVTDRGATNVATRIYRAALLN